MINNHMKRCLFYVIKDLQNTTGGTTVDLSKWLKSRMLIIPNEEESVLHWGLSFIAWGNAEHVLVLEDSWAVSYNIRFILAT